MKKIGFKTLLVFAFILIMSGCAKKENDMLIELISQINHIDDSIKESILSSPTLEVNIEDLPKTININNKQYPIEYKKEYLLIKDFNNATYCNKEFSSNKNDGINIVGLMTIRTLCIDKNMQVVYKKLGY